MKSNKKKSAPKKPTFSIANPPSFEGEGEPAEFTTTLRTAAGAHSHPMLSLSITNIPATKEEDPSTPLLIAVDQLVWMYLGVIYENADKTDPSIVEFEQNRLIEYLAYVKIRFGKHDVLKAKDALTPEGEPMHQFLKHASKSLLEDIAADRTDVIVLSAASFKNGMAVKNGRLMTDEEIDAMLKADKGRDIQRVRRSYNYSIHLKDVLRSSRKKALLDEDTVWYDQKQKDYGGQRFFGVTGGMKQVEGLQKPVADPHAFVFGRTPRKNYDPSKGRRFNQEGRGIVFLVDLGLVDGIESTHYEMLQGPHKYWLGHNVTPAKYAPVVENIGAPDPHQPLSATLGEIAGVAPAEDPPQAPASDPTDPPIVVVSAPPPIVVVVEEAPAT